jgi:lipoate-protein ligase A
MVEDRKLLGSAQVRQGNAFLQHGSLLLEDDQQLVSELTAGEQVVGHETTLRQATGRSVGFIEASLAVSRAARPWSPNWTPLPPPDAAKFAELGARFRDPQWTWRR